MVKGDYLHPVPGVSVSPANTQAYQTVRTLLALFPLVTFRRIEWSNNANYMQTFSGAEIPDNYTSPDAKPFATLKFSGPTSAAPKSAADIADVILSVGPPEGFRLQELTIICRKQGDGSVYEFFTAYQPI